MARPATVTIYLFDSAARLVFKRDVVLAAGHNEVTWTGVTDFGEVASNGVYPLRVVVNGSVVGRSKIWVVKR